MECPNCGKRIPEEDAFCGKCGQLLKASLREVVQTELQNQLGANYKDQKLLAIETAESTVERIEKWSKWFLVALGIPTAILLATLAILGVTSYHEAIQKIDTAVKTGEDRVAGATGRANDAEQKAADASRKIGEVQKVAKSAEEAVKSLESIRSEQRSRLERNQAEIAKLEQRLRVLADSVERDVASLQGRVDFVQGAALPDFSTSDVKTTINIRDAMDAALKSGKPSDLKKVIDYVNAMGQQVPADATPDEVRAAVRAVGKAVVQNPALREKQEKEARKARLIQ